MADSLTTSLTLTLSAKQTKDMDIQDAICNLNYTFSDDLASGTGSDQADLIFHDQGTVTAAAQDLDLAGILTDAFGTVLTFAKVKLLYIENTNTTAAQNLSVGGDAVAAFVDWVADATDKVVVKAGGVLLLWAPKDGYTVTATTGDLLQIDPGASTIIYKIIIVGTSA